MADMSLSPESIRQRRKHHLGDIESLMINVRALEAQLLALQKMCKHPEFKSLTGIAGYGKVCEDCGLEV